jgi:hypothetical protein
MPVTSFEEKLKLPLLHDNNALDPTVPAKPDAGRSAGQCAQKNFRGPFRCRTRQFPPRFRFAGTTAVGALAKESNPRPHRSIHEIFMIDGSITMRDFNFNSVKHKHPCAMRLTFYAPPRNIAIDISLY